MASDLRNRVAVVSGGSRGLGRAISSVLAAAGASVAVNYANRVAPADETVADLAAAGGTGVAIQGDVTTESGAAHVIGAARERFGRVDIVVNNATGPQPRVAIADSTWETYVDQLRFGVAAPLHLGRAALEGMRSAGWGRIINIGSEVVARPGAGFSAYTTAKAAMVGLTRAWAQELGPDGITVNVVAPGFTPVERHADVPQQERDAYIAEVPLSRIGRPTDVADVVAFVASDAARYVTGQIITVNGGRTYGM